MNSVPLADNVWWVGVKDPDLRIFDIVMETKQGTTYNAYLVKGEKIALIDTVKKQFSDEYFAKVSQLVPLESIDYLIVNHTEPDHSGAIVELLRRCPKLEIYCSASAVPFVKSTINREAKIIGVKDEQQLDLGGKKLTFKVLPYMHWPDTMMEYLAEDRILFSCDGFAAHIAGESIWDDQQTGDLEWEVKYYFDCIMRPFTGYMRKSLPKLDALDIAMIATSHGPVLRTNVRSYLERYKTWSVDKTVGAERVPVFYATNYGNTGLLAEAMATHLKALGFESRLIDITQTPADDIREEIERSIAVVVGTPTFNGDAPKPIWDFLALFSTVYSLGKKAATFGSYGWGGEAPKLVLDRLAGLKLKVYPEPLKTRLIPSESEMAEVKVFADKIGAFFRGAEVTDPVTAKT